MFSVRLLLLTWAVLLLGWLSGCTSTPAGNSGPVTAQPRDPVIAVALGGGGAKGYAHIGVLKVLESHGIKPQIVTGTSAGSLVGSLYASGMSPYQLQQTAVALKESDLRDFTLNRQGFLSGDRLKNYVNAQVKNVPIQNFPRKFAAVATELKTGKKMVFNRGNTGLAVQASCSIPNIFVPATINGQQYVDGGLTSPIPVSVARNMGADIVIAVDISARPKAAGAASMTGLLDQTLNIMGQSLIQQELSGADIIISPAVTHLGTLDLTQKNNNILAGEQAAQIQVEKIKQAIISFRNSPAARQPARSSVYR